MNRQFSTIGAGEPINEMASSTCRVIGESWDLFNNLSQESGEPAMNDPLLQRLMVRVHKVRYE